MIRTACVYSISNFPQVDIEDRIKDFICPELTPLSVEVIGWEKWDDDNLVVEHQGLYVLQIARRLRRIPKSLLDEHVHLEMLKFSGQITAQEKKQLKQRVIDKLLPMVMPEKTLTCVLIDKKYQTLTLACQSDALVEKILRVFQDTFPGITVARRWSKDVVRRSIGKSWKNDDWPNGMKPDGDAALVHASAQYQKIRFTGLSDMSVVDDSLLHGYVIVGLRLSHTEGLSCYLTPHGNFQGLRYPAAEESEHQDQHFDWLPVLELREWIETFGVWVHGD